MLPFFNKLSQTIKTYKILDSFGKIIQGANKPVKFDKHFSINMYVYTLSTLSN